MEEQVEQRRLGSLGLRNRFRIGSAHFRLDLAGLRGIEVLVERKNEVAAATLAVLDSDGNRCHPTALEPRNIKMKDFVLVIPNVEVPIRCGIRAFRGDIV